MVGKIIEYFRKRMESVTARTLRTNSIDSGEFETYHLFSKRLEKIENGFSVGNYEHITLSGSTDTSTWGASAFRAFVAGDIESYGLADVRPKMPFCKTNLGRIIIDNSRELAATLAFICVSGAIAQVNAEEARRNLWDWENLGRIPMDLIQGRFRTEARSLLKHATGWAGNDLEERLAEVCSERSKI